MQKKCHYDNIILRTISIGLSFRKEEVLIIIVYFGLVQTIYMESLEQQAQEYKDRWFVDYFNSMICASSTHKDLSKDEIDFQRHSHKSTCYKTNKGVMNIAPDEGFDTIIMVGWVILMKCRNAVIISLNFLLLKLLY